MFPNTSLFEVLLLMPKNERDIIIESLDKKVLRSLYEQDAPQVGSQEPSAFQQFMNRNLTPEAIEKVNRSKDYLGLGVSGAREYIKQAPSELKTGLGVAAVGLSLMYLLRRLLGRTVEIRINRFAHQCAAIKDKKTKINCQIEMLKNLIAITDTAIRKSKDDTEKMRLRKSKIKYETALDELVNKRRTISRPS